MAPSAPSATPQQPQPAQPGQPAQPRPPAKGARVTRACRTRHRTRTRTCRYYRASRLYKTCVKKRTYHRYHCRYAHSSGAAEPVVHAHSAASTELYFGFATQPLSTVVRIYWYPKAGYGPATCSGTIIRRGLILTAAHCVFANKIDGPREGYPEGFYANTFHIVPGNNTSNGYGVQGSGPYGEWTASRYWAGDDYFGGATVGGDWAVIAVNPNAQGQYPGDVIGAQENVTWNAPIPDGTEFFLTGYPASGIFQTNPSFGYGNHQYICDATWSRPGLTGAGYGTYYALDFDPCQLNGGASGGPVFMHQADGSWTIIGVNNRGNLRADGYGQDMQSFYMDGRFGTLWQEVLTDLGAG